MMKPWQQDINNEVKESLLNIIRDLREKNPKVGFSLNYGLVFPDKFMPGTDTRVPITVPSSNGLYHLGDVVISTDLDSNVVGTNLNIYQNVGLFDRAAQEGQESGSETVTDVLWRIGDFCDSVLGVMRSDQMKSLLVPSGSEVSSYDSAGIAVGGSTAADRRSIPVNMIDGGSGFGQNRAMSWDRIKTSARRAEVIRAKNMKTKEQRQAFIEEALDNISGQPQWYAVLGGRQKEMMKEKIADAYLKQCEASGTTLLPTDFLEAARKSMAKQGKLVPYCTAASRRVEGTHENICLNKSCSIYSPNCQHLSYRLRTDLL